MSATTSEKIQAAMGGLMTAVGLAGVLAPRRLVVSSAEAEITDDSLYSTELWTMREAALGLILLGTRKSAQRGTVLGVTVGLAITEVIVGLRSPALTGRGQATAVATAAAFGGAGLFALLSGRRESA